MKSSMTISRFAEAGGVGVETVRFYQRRGLLPVPRSASNAFREYDNELLKRLRFIRKAQLAGFTLSEVKELLRLDSTRERARIRAISEGKLAELDAHIRELRGVRRSLQALIHHCETAPAGRRCPIIASFDSGGHALH